MTTYSRWRNPKGARKSNDFDVIILLLVSFMSPFLILAAWIQPLAGYKTSVPPLNSCKLLIQWWKEVLE